jgi:hypothetical protein
MNRRAAPATTRQHAVFQEVVMDPWDLSVALFGGVAVMFFGASIMIALAG